MGKRIVGAIVAAAAAVSFGVVTSSAADAAPIDCPNGQTATKVDSGWDCINNGGNRSNAEDPKNPNAGKGDF